MVLRSLKSGKSSTSLACKSMTAGWELLSSPDLKLDAASAASPWKRPPEFSSLIGVGKWGEAFGDASSRGFNHMVVFFRWAKYPNASLGKVIRKGGTCSSPRRIRSAAALNSSSWSLYGMNGYSMLIWGIHRSNTLSYSLQEMSPCYQKRKLFQSEIKLNYVWVLGFSAVSAAMAVFMAKNSMVSCPLTIQQRGKGHYSKMGPNRK